MILIIWFICKSMAVLNIYSISKSVHLVIFIISGRMFSCRMIKYVLPCVNPFFYYKSSQHRTIFVINYDEFNSFKHGEEIFVFFPRIFGRWGLKRHIYHNLGFFYKIYFPLAHLTLIDMIFFSICALNKKINC